MKEIYKKIVLISLFFLFHTPLLPNDSLGHFSDSEYRHGLYLVDFIRLALGILIIIGGWGYFITTSTKRAHWPLYIRRFFFGVFVFCNIFFHAIFNVLNLPNNKKIVFALGKHSTQLLG